jgi:hypothetical protein
MASTTKRLSSHPHSASLSLISSVLKFEVFYVVRSDLQIELQFYTNRIDAPVNSSIALPNAFMSKGFRRTRSAPHVKKWAMSDGSPVERKGEGEERNK